jgi:ArsR family transcriptional regulator, arsenate/arsenite/antimonite-responsive transcriptional repressor
MHRRDVTIFKALSDPNRIRILKMLQCRELCVCEVREVLSLSISTVSKHLSILRDAGLITDAKEGKWVNYRLSTADSVGFVRLQLSLIQKTFADDVQIKSDKKKLKTVDRNVICKS